jgi:hypothetical protein
MKAYLRSFFIFSIVSLLALLGGCASGPTPQSYTLNFTLDKALEGTSLQVDIIGANAVADLPKWEAYSITDYWQPGNVTRRDADKISIEFGRGKPTAQSVAVSNPKWNAWLKRGVLYVVVLADLPGVSADKQGNADSRRLILPLDKAQWANGDQKIDVLIQESGLRLLTPKKT